VGVWDLPMMGFVGLKAGDPAGERLRGVCGREWGVWCSSGEEVTIAGIMSML
jgi:hypothetical protein